MADVAIVGADLGGLATAARLAKLGHRVTVLEAGSRPSGLLGVVEQDGFRWDAIPFQTSIPAVLRDLFRKSGRPIERYVDLQLSTPARRHVFADGTTLDLPTGSRGAQQAVVSEALGAVAGEAWTRFVDDLADTWNVLRAEVLDRPDGPGRLADRRLARSLGAGRSMNRLLRKAFRDTRLRELASYPMRRAGGDPSTAPAFAAVEAYVERSFGVWRLAGGSDDLASAMLTRMAEREVDLRFGSDVAALCTMGGRVEGVDLVDGSHLRADLTVIAGRAHHLLTGPLHGSDGPTTQAPSSATPPQPRRRATHLGLAGELPALPAEVVLHGDPLVVLTTSDAAPRAHQAWTAVVSSSADVDAVDLLAVRGVDVTSRVVSRLDRWLDAAPPTWPAGRDAAALSGVAPTVAGLRCLGTGLVLGSGVPYVAWQAAHVAELVGRA